MEKIKIKHFLFVALIFFTTVTRSQVDCGTDWVCFYHEQAKKEEQQQEQQEIFRTEQLQLETDQLEELKNQGSLLEEQQAKMEEILQRFDELERPTTQTNSGEETP
jgi:hypothetical protein